MDPKISTSVWIATALLHKENPGRTHFTGPEIIQKLRVMGIQRPASPAVYAHLSRHCIANRPPQPNRLRFLYREDPPTSRRVVTRLFRAGDDFHPARKNGEILPPIEDIPEEYRYLVTWYRQHYSNEGKVTQTDIDPIIGLRGVGKALWDAVGGTRFIQQIRQDWDAIPESRFQPGNESAPSAYGRHK